MSEVRSKEREREKRKKTFFFDVALALGFPASVESCAREQVLEDSIFPRASRRRRGGERGKAPKEREKTETSSMAMTLMLSLSLSLSLFLRLTFQLLEHEPARRGHDRRSHGACSAHGHAPGARGACAPRERGKGESGVGLAERASERAREKVTTTSTTREHSLSLLSIFLLFDGASTKA